MSKAIKRIGLTIASLGLIACSQAPSFANSDFKVASAPHSSAHGKKAKRSLNAKSIYAEFDRLTKKPCKQQKKIVGKTRYTLCTANNRIVSAASSLASEGDGVGYWLNEQGAIYAIRYFHSGEVFVLMPDDKKTVVELVGKRDIKVTVNEARWNQLELTARDAIVEIAEQFDNPAAQHSSDREAVTQVTLKYFNHQSPGAKVKPVIRKIAIVENTALLSWLQGEAGGMTLLKKQENAWYVVESGGGAMSLMTLSEAGITRRTAEALLNQINPNWNKP